MAPTGFKTKKEPSTAAADKDAVSAIQEGSSADSITENDPSVKKRDAPKNGGKSNEDIQQLLSEGLQLPQAMADDVLAKHTVSQEKQGVKL